MYKAPNDDHEYDVADKLKFNMWCNNVTRTIIFVGIPSSAARQIFVKPRTTEGKYPKYTQLGVFSAKTLTRAEFPLIPHAKNVIS